MAENLFDTNIGFATDLTNRIDGVGAPIGTAGFTDSSPVGSMYLESGSGDIYIKRTSTSSAIDWERMARVSDLGGNVTQDFDAVTGATIVASMLVDTYRRMDIILDVTDPLTGNGRSIKIDMTHDGVATADASDFESVRFARMRHGALAGVTIVPSLTGAGITQAMTLTVTSVTSVNVRVRIELLEI